MSSRLVGSASSGRIEGEHLTGLDLVNPAVRVQFVPRQRRSKGSMRPEMLQLIEYVLLDRRLQTGFPFLNVPIFFVDDPLRGPGIRQPRLHCWQFSDHVGINNPLMASPCELPQITISVIFSAHTANSMVPASPRGEAL